MSDSTISTIKQELPRTMGSMNYELLFEYICKAAKEYELFKSMCEFNCRLTKEERFRILELQAQNTKLTTALELIVSTMRNRGSLSYAYIADCMAGIAADTLEGMKGE